MTGAATRAAALALGRVALSEVHLWYELDPGSKLTLASPLQLRRGGPADVELLDALDTIPPWRARERLEAGHDLWLVLDGQRLLFSAWTFRRRAPVLAAPDGRIELPDDTACLEDPVTATSARGHGLAPAALTAIATALAREGIARIITKVERDNLSARNAFEKAGFEPVAVMHLRRRGWRKRTWLDNVRDSRGAFYAQRLGCAQPDPRRRRTSGETFARNRHAVSPQ